MSTEKRQELSRFADEPRISKDRQDHSKNEKQKQDSLDGATLSVQDGGVTRGTRETHDRSNIKHQASKNNAATAQATEENHQYDLQMDQFQVIDSKDKASSVLASPPPYTKNDTANAAVTSNQPQLVKPELLQEEQRKRQEAAAHTNQEAKDASAAVKRETQQKEQEFFLTGVNVQNQDIEPYAIEAAQPDDISPRSERIESKDLLIDQELSAQIIDQYKMLAVVDSGRSFSNNECVYVNMSKNEICHLAVDSHTSLRFDELISSYEQVFKIGQAMAHTFMTRRNTNKVIINNADQFATNNNCGFNLANFKLKFLKNYYNEVVSDYERSFIGSFTHQVLETYLPNTNDQYELFFTIAKFEGNMGYSLTQNIDEVKIEVEIDDINHDQQNSPNQHLKQQQDVQTLENKANNDYAYERGDQQQHQQLLKAKGLQNAQSEAQDSTNRAVAEESQQKLQVQKHTSKQAQERRQEIIKKGSIPEFVPVANSMDFYTLYQEANHRNKLLVEAQRLKLIEQKLKGEPIDLKQAQQHASENENIDLKNIKDDIVMMQFKLVRKDNMKVMNTMTFVNMPTTKMNDINISTLIEIIQKQNACQANQSALSSKKQQQQKRESQFLPYNKSILTRILYPYLNKCNLLVLNHYSKKTILRHLRQPVTGYQTGPAKGLFNQLFRLGFDVLNRLKKRKLQQKAALQILERTFKHDLVNIHKEIAGFREGIKSFEVYTRQTATQMAGSSQSAVTMFHQMMHFLVLQEEMQADAEVFCNNNGASSFDKNKEGVSQTNPNNFFPSLLPEEEIQKVIFDDNYLEYIQKKHRSQDTSAIQDAYQGIVSSANSVSETGLKANTSLHLAAQLAKESQMPHQRANLATSEKQKKLQFVQYEYVKSELKEEYDKRVGFLHKRLNKKAQMDPSFMLLNNMSSQPFSTSNQRQSESQIFFQDSSSNRHQFGQQMQLQKKILGGPSQHGNRLTKSKTSQGATLLQANNRGIRAARGGKEDFQESSKDDRKTKKADYYKFYLDNAQKAIDLMIEQHKSQSNLNQGAAAMRNSSNNRALSQSSHESPDAAFEARNDAKSVMGLNAYQTATGHSTSHGLRKIDINRSNSTHSGKFNARLEPLVQRHQKISRIAVKNHNEASYEKKQLEQIDETYKTHGSSKLINYNTNGQQTSVNNRRSKPFSANQQKNKLIAQVAINHHKNMMAAASTHYTYTNFPNNATSSQNVNQINQSETNKNMLLMNATVISSSQQSCQNIVSQQQQILNKGSDHDLYDRRPVTSGNEYNTQFDYRSQVNSTSMLQTNDSIPRAGTTDGYQSSGQRLVYRLNASKQQLDKKAAGINNNSYSQGMYTQNQSQQAHSSAKPLHNQTTSSRRRSGAPGKNLLPPTSNQRRLLSKNIRSGLRGELQAGGFKSLRAQGMLRAGDLSGGAREIGNSIMGQRQGSGLLLENNVNICIEKNSSATHDVLGGWGHHIQRGETIGKRQMGCVLRSGYLLAHPRPRDVGSVYGNGQELQEPSTVFKSQDNLDKSFKRDGVSPSRVNPNLYPRGIDQPKKDKQYQKVRKQQHQQQSVSASKEGKKNKKHSQQIDSTAGRTSVFGASSDSLITDAVDRNINQSQMTVTTNQKRASVNIAEASTLEQRDSVEHHQQEREPITQISSKHQ